MSRRKGDRSERLPLGLLGLPARISCTCAAGHGRLGEGEGASPGDWQGVALGVKDAAANGAIPRLLAVTHKLHTGQRRGVCSPVSSHPAGRSVGCGTHSTT